ncbi:LamG domain-containing protein, partial [Candidatus Woesearchaeota archaeon]|nr:LamG domain-containing protein [Candidatus Woesearchaeota archaeon]
MLRNYTYINITLPGNTTSIDSVIVNWNGTNVTVDDPSLLLALDFNNNSNDRSSYANSVAQNSGVNCLNTTQGIFGGACKYSAAGQHHLITGTPALNVTSMKSATIMMWLNTPNYTSSGENPRLLQMSANTTGGATSGWDVVIRGADSLNRVCARFVRGGTTGPLDNRQTATGFPVNKWTHLAIVWSGTAAPDIYVDAVLNNGAGISGGTNLGAGCNTIQEATGNLRISGGTAPLSNGMIDELRIWNRSLTAAEINASYQAELGRVNGTTLSYFANFTNLAEGNYTYFVYANDTAGNFNSTVNRNFVVSYAAPTLAFVSPTDADNTTIGLLRNYTLINVSILNSTALHTVILSWNGTNVTIDDPSLVFSLDLNNNTKDRSRYGNDGYEYNGVNCSTSDLGRFGTGCVFDGINDYIEVNNSASLNATNQTFTVTAWINLSDTSTHILYTRWNQDLTDRVWAVMSDAGFTFSNSTTGADFSVNLVTLGPAFSAGTWYHTAVVFNGTHVIGYVNGVNTGSGKVVLRNSTGNTGLRLGRDWNGGLGTSFKGSMDEVR